MHSLDKFDQVVLILNTVFQDAGIPCEQISFKLVKKTSLYKQMIEYRARKNRALNCTQSNTNQILHYLHLLGILSFPVFQV